MNIIQTYASRNNTSDDEIETFYDAVNEEYTMEKQDK